MPLLLAEFLQEILLDDLDFIVLHGYLCNSDACDYLMDVQAYIFTWIALSSSSFLYQPNAIELETCAQPPNLYKQISTHQSIPWDCVSFLESHMRVYPTTLDDVPTIHMHTVLAINVVVFLSLMMVGNWGLVLDYGVLVLNR